MASDKVSQRMHSEVRCFSPKSSTLSSYAAVSYPKRDQGLILDCVEGLNLTDYTCAVGDLVLPKNVISSSRISNNRICIYLTSKEHVNAITDKTDYLQIGDKKISIRPLLTNNKKVIFSNVPSNLPNCIFEDILEELNVSRVSQITILKATIAKEGYNHVTSFRRQVYVKPEDVCKIPETFKIEFEGANYFIYSSTDSLKCFICNIEGHLAKNCKAIPSQNSSTNSHFSQISAGMENSTAPHSTNINTNNIGLTDTNTISEFPPMGIPTTDGTSQNPGIKRTHSDISSSQSTHTQEQLNYENFKAPLTKKQSRNKKKTKEDPNEALDIMLEPIKELLKDNNTYALSYLQLKSLIDNVQGSNNPTEIVLQYTSDINVIISLLQKLYPYLNHRTMKRRFTGIINKLKKYNDISDDNLSQTDEESSTQEELSIQEDTSLQEEY